MANRCRRVRPVQLSEGACMWCVFCVATDTNKHTHTHVLYKFTRGYSCTHRGCVHMRLLHRTYRLASRLCTLRTCHLIHGPPGVKPLVKQQETPVITGLFALIWTLDPNGTKHLGAHSHCFISSTVKTIIFMIVVLQLHCHHHSGHTRDFKSYKNIS